MVVDASALVEYLLVTDAGRGVDQEVSQPDTVLHTPALCDVEVASTLRRTLLQERLSLQRVEVALRS